MLAPQLPGGERVPFLFTIKELAAKGTLDGFGGDFMVPSYRGSSFLDPKVLFLVPTPPLCWCHSSCTARAHQRLQANILPGPAVARSPLLCSHACEQRTPLRG